jgi:uncharacterized glyoxalase superfamily protein PhnB
MPHLDAIGIVTADMAASCRFYRLLGVEVADPTLENDHHEATLPSGLRLMWDTVDLIKKLHPDWQPPVGQRLGLAFHCDTAAGVDETYASVVEAGFTGTSEPWDAFWGQRYAQVVDPDGNDVDLFAPLAA